MNQFVGKDVHLPAFTPTLSNGTLSDEINAQRRLMFDQIAAVLADDALMEKVKAAADPALTRLELLNFQLGAFCTQIFPQTDEPEK